MRRRFQFIVFIFQVISRMLYVCDSFRRLKVDEYEYVAIKVLALMLPGKQSSSRHFLCESEAFRFLDVCFFVVVFIYKRLIYKYLHNCAQLREADDVQNVDCSRKMSQSIFCIAFSRGTNKYIALLHPKAPINCESTLMKTSSMLTRSVWAKISCTWCTFLLAN